MRAPYAPSGGTAAESPAIDLASIIDRQLSPYQLKVCILCALVVLLDGIDTQVVGIGAPLIGKSLGIAPAMFGWIFSAGTAGAAVGAFAGGIAADRYGRKKILVIATLLFGAATFATAWVNDFESLFLLRGITGLGLGGAVPCFVALASEYAPQRWRARVASLVWAAFPLGASAGALLNSYVVASLGWRPLFLIWGAAPLAIGVLHIVVLPESARFLATRGHRENELRQILSSIAPGSVESNVVITTPEDDRRTGASLDLFRHRLAFPSGALALISFVAFGTLTLLATWTPTLLVSQGTSPSAAAITISIYGLGSFLGTAGAALLFARLGIQRAIAPSILGACVAIGASGLVAPAAAFVNLFYGLSGLFLGACSSAVVALAAITYPTALRSTGIGWVMGAGRAGAVVGPLAAGLLVAWHWPMMQLMFLIGLMMLVMLPALLALPGPAAPMLEAEFDSPTIARRAELDAKEA